MKEKGVFVTKKEAWREWLETFLIWAVKNRFYGKLTLSFEAGRLVHLKREETMKPPKDQ